MQPLCSILIAALCAGLLAVHAMAQTAPDEFTAATPSASRASLQPAAVLEVMESVADFALANPEAISPSNRKRTEWTWAAFYTGMMALGNISTNPAYLAAMRRMGESNQWQLGARKFDADDHCVGQTYADLFLRYRDAAMIKPMQKVFDDILANPTEVQSLEFTRTQARARENWSWCDALFMGPPAWVRLWKATDDPRYLDFAVTNWWRTSDYLNDTSEHLYFRDSTFFDKREANGRKVFWSRGNGWVMAGLVRVLQFLPEDHAVRDRFLQQYREMAERILTCQQPDGLWRASLLDPASYPLKETSGSSFYTYAIAWGVNRGLLERDKFGPAARQAWAALVECVTPEGRLTHVQPVGSDPKQFDPNTTETYGIGAFLLAGSEIHQLIQTQKSP